VSLEAVIKAIRIHAHGGPEVMRWERIELPPPAAGEARVRHTAVALNFSDLNVRRGGFYRTSASRFPLILGNEAAGVVEEVGPGVGRVRPGDRVAYVGVGGPFFERTGAYAEARNVPADRLVLLPDEVTEEQAAGFLLKGITAAMIVNRVRRPKPGETILVHAAAGGVGLVLSQWSRHLGATVIGTVGSAEKAEAARRNGCAHTILYRETDFVAEVKTLVPGGVDAVFDGVGRDTFERSFDCVRPFGMLVNYGNASGHPPPIDLLRLSVKGSLAVSRPGFHHYIDDPASLRAACAELFELLRAGVLTVAIGRRYALEDAASAHRDVEARAIAGSVVLVPAGRVSAGTS
jgi:NADPH2:quinone reductase